MSVTFTLLVALSAVATNEVALYSPARQDADVVAGVVAGALVGSVDTGVGFALIAGGGVVEGVAAGAAELHPTSRAGRAASRINGRRGDDMAGSLPGQDERFGPVGRRPHYLPGGSS